MRTVKNWERRERFYSGHYSAHFNIVVRYKGKEYELESGHGTRDTLDVFRVKGTTYFYIVSVNTGLPYVGVAAYDLEHYRLTRKSDSEPVKPFGEVFLQEHQVDETLGEGGERLHPMTIAKRLDEYLAY